MAHLQPQTRYRLRAKTSVRPPPDMAEAMIRQDVWLPDFIQAEELAQEEGLPLQFGGTLTLALAGCRGSL